MIGVLNVVADLAVLAWVVPLFAMSLASANDESDGRTPGAQKWWNRWRLAGLLCPLVCGVSKAIVLLWGGAG